jgi:D-tyrosyl-tRNA(Tyr) deacylase
MKLLIQRTSRGEVFVNRISVGSINSGFVVFVGIAQTDNHQLIDRLVERMLRLRIFPDEQGKMNKSILETQGEILLISQFTLYANCAKGYRPSFGAAAPSETAAPLYRYCVERVAKSGLKTETGAFGAQMRVTLTNDGPITILLDSDDQQT